MRIVPANGGATLPPKSEHVNQKISPIFGPDDRPVIHPATSPVEAPPLPEPPMAVRLAELAEAVNAALALLDRLGLIVATPGEAVAIQGDPIRLQNLAASILQTGVRLNMACLEIGC